MKAYRIFLAAALLAALGTACGQTLPASSDTGSGAASAASSAARSAEQSADGTTQTPEMLAAYADALQGLYTEHVFPDGSDSGYAPSFGEIFENQFAVCDVDGDGSDELILSFSTAPMAGMRETVYGYDASAGKLTEELTEFPGMTYYDNGMVQAGWSHNQGLSNGDFWPYTLYTYDAGADCYQEIARVDSWDKSIAETDDQGRAFPTDVDAKGDGVVYLLTEGEESTKTISQEDYDQWRTDKLGTAAELTIPFQPLTQENLSALG